MNETLDFNAYLSYFLVAAYYVIMLRLWLPPRPSSNGDGAGNDKPTGMPDGNSSREPLRQTPHNGEPEPQARALQWAGQPLEHIRAADERFDEAAFLSGASQAYELVVNAYAEGNTSTLKNLLGPEVATTFCAAIQERREKGESVALDFICIRELDIVDAWLEGDVAEISVRFVSELVKTTRAADNTIVDGDPDRIVAVADLWTFARRISSPNPNWTTIATDGY